MPLPRSLRMKIKVKCFAIMLFLSLLISYSYFALCVLLAVFFHELGHILAARYLKINFSELKLDIFGASLSPVSNDFSYKDEIFLCICGPLSNVITSFLALPILLLLKHDSVAYFILASLTLAFLNLLPIRSFDGGRIFSALLCLMTDTRISHIITSAISFIFILLLWMISVYLLLIARSNLSLFVFSISLFIKIFVKEN